VPYPGLLNAFQYAEDIKAAMLEQISASVTACEEEARTKTVNGVSTIKSLGILHLGDEYTDMSFRSDMMFRRKRDVLATSRHGGRGMGLLRRRQVVGETGKGCSTGMAMTVVGVLGAHDRRCWLDRRRNGRG
jgi:mitofusin